MPPLHLFHAANACSLASVIALDEAQLPYTLEMVDLQSDRTAYRKVVPSGRVPAFLIGDELLVESPAILLRIAALAPDRGLVPEETAAQSQLLSVLSWCASSVHIARRRLRRPNHFTTDATAQAVIARDALPAVRDNLAQLDARVKGADWMAGDRFTVADAYAIVFYAWAIMDGIDLSGLPNLQRWAAAMLERPLVRGALERDRSPALAGTPKSTIA